jgi:hypothetical protein
MQIHAALSIFEITARIFSRMCRAIACMNSGGTLLPICLLHCSCFAGQRKSGSKLPISAISSIVRDRGGVVPMEMILRLRSTRPTRVQFRGLE